MSPRMPGPRRLRTVSLVLLVVSAALAPMAAAQQDGAEQGERLVSQSLWGVKQSVGLTLAREYATNYGERAFWEERPDGEGVRVAIVDTGIDLDHPDLATSLACGHCWRDLVNQRPAPYDDHGHGTHVAGILAGRGHTQLNPLESYFPTGARGIAPGAELIVAKAMNASGTGKDARVAEAVSWSLDPDGDPATDDGADIIHLSLGIEDPSQRTVPGGPRVDTGSETEQAVRRAIEAGVFVVMSAGNQGREEAAPPAGVDGVIAVGALDGSGRVLSFSNTGRHVDVYAPGVVTSAWPLGLDEDGIEDGYTGLAGTSQAAPVVSGVLALALEAGPSLQAGGGATKVAHMEELVQRTGQPVDQGPAGAVQVDAAAVVASQDAGADGMAWGVVIMFTLLALALVAFLGRLLWGLLARAVEEQNGEQGPRPGAAAQAGAGQASQSDPEEDESSAESSSSSTGSGARFRSAEE